MRLATISLKGREVAAIVNSKGLVPIEKINEKLKKSWFATLYQIIESGQLEEIKGWYHSGGKGQLEDMKEDTILVEEVKYAPLLRNPHKIWGIGLNYVDHAADLSEKAPDTEPASFMKPDTTIIGPGDTIKIPLQSHKTTAEAELGIVIGKKSKNVRKEDWLSVVAGFTSVIDMTAEDILRKNPRYLTRAKSFDTFFSIGPELITPDEIEDILKLKVATVKNGKVHAQNFVANMTFPPDFLVSFHSEVMTLLPGDIISTGTPRAVQINHGDVVECWIDGFKPLINPVEDLKKT